MNDRPHGYLQIYFWIAGVIVEYAALEMTRNARLSGLDGREKSLDFVFQATAFSRERLRGR